MIVVIKKFTKFLVIVIVIVLVLLAFSWAWLSYGSMNKAKQKVFSVLPFPAVTVNGHPVSLRTYIVRYKMAENFSKQMGAAPQDLKSTVFGRLIEEAKIEQLAERKGVAASREQVDREYRRREKEYASQTQGKLADALGSYGVSEREYREEFLKAEINAANLAAWYYGQRGLNPGAYQTADNIISSLQAGAKFADLAKAYSQDDQTKSLGGDLGFIKLDETLLEVENVLKDAQSGQTKVMPTRYGLQIVYIENIDYSGGDDALKFHIRQIFLNGGDFENWYEQETKNFKIIKIVNI